MAEGLTLREMRSITGRISYKPGWKFTFQEHHNEFAIFQVSPGVLIEAKVQSSRAIPGIAFRPGDCVEVTVAWPVIIFAPRTQYEFMQQVKRGIAMLEDHERDEWFAVDGFLVRDPHEGGKPVRVAKPDEFPLPKPSNYLGFRDKMVDL